MAPSRGAAGALGNGSNFTHVVVSQTGGGSFSIGGSGSPELHGGNKGTAIVETTSPVSITNANFVTLFGTALTTSGTITLAEGLNLDSNGVATITATGVGANAGPTYGFGEATLVLTGGTTDVAPGETLKSGALTVQGGVLQDDGALSPKPASVALTGGTLKGTGTVDASVTNSGGVLAPGDSPGQLTIAGSYEETSGGTLAIAIAGATPVSGFSQLDVHEAVTLAGTLALSDEGGFTPTVGETFEFITGASSRSGTFASLSGPSGGLYNVTYEPHGATLTVKPPPPTVTEVLPTKAPPRGEPP